MQNFLNSTTQTVAWFRKRDTDKELELKAPFQRNPVWSDRQKSYLIDSILRGFPIPEIYMQEFTDAEGHSKCVIVDGQQRLRACLEFLDDKLTLDPEDSPDFADMSFSDLSKDQKTQIYNYNFVVRKLPEMPDSDIRAMFQRLNRNVVALNSQELRHATYWGEFIKCIEALSSDERWSLFGVFTPNDVRRMIDAEYVSELVIAFLHGLQNKKDTLDDWYRAYEKDFPGKTLVESVVPATLGEIISILPDISKTRWRKKSDFYSLFLVLLRYSHLFPLSREGRRDFQEKLYKFGEYVDSFLSNPDYDGISDPVKKYAFAVERAASDLQNRKTRDFQINELLKDVLEAEQKGVNISQST